MLRRAPCRIRTWCRSCRARRAESITAGCHPARQRSTIFHSRSMLCSSQVLLVINDVSTDLAAKDPIRPAGVHQYDWQQEQGADQKEGLRLRRRSRIPQGDTLPNDVWKTADREAAVAQR